MGSKKAAVKAISWVAAFAAAMLPAAASAYSPAQGDLSVALVLARLFGSAMAGSAMDGAVLDPLGGMLRSINACALAVGGVLAAYTLVAGIVQTAHDGEVLGKKWSSMWVPIRTVLGLSLAIPLGGGYCLAQSIVMSVVLQGVGLADSAWSAFLAGAAPSLIGAPTATPPAVAKLAFDALQMQVCMATLQNARAFPGGDKVQPISPSIGKFADAAGGGFEFGFAGASGYHPGSKSACGSLRYATWAETAPAAQADPQGYSALARAVDAQQGSDAAQAVLAAHQASLGPLVDAMGRIAAGIASPSGPSFADPGAFDRAVKAYQDAVAKAAQGSDPSAAAKAASDASASAGWIWAGAWFQSVGSSLAMVDDASKAVPTARSLPDFPELSSVGVPVDALAQNLKMAYGFYEGSASAGAGAALPPYGLDHPVAGVSYAYEESNRMERWVGGWFAGVDASRLRFDPRHPIFVARELGSQVQSSLSQSVAALMAAPSASPGLGGVQGPLLAGLLLPAFAAAGMLSSALPLIPLCMGLLAGFGWALLVVEAMAAAPLWAVMHLAPSGEGAMGSAKAGYAMLLSLALRPALAVMGFCAAAMVSHPLGMVADAVFMKAFAHAPGSISAAVGMVAALCAQAAALGFLMWRCFALGLSMPDALLSWIGAQSGAFAGAAAGEQGAAGAPGAAGQAGQSGSAGSSGLSGASGSVLSGLGAAQAAGAAMARVFGRGYQAPAAAKESEGTAQSHAPQMQEKRREGVQGAPGAPSMSVDKVEITANSAVFKDGEGGRASAGDIADLVATLKDSVLSRRDAGESLAKAGKPVESAQELALAEGDMESMRSELRKLSALAKEAVAQAELAMSGPATGSVEARRQAGLARAAALALQAEAAALLDMSKASKAGSGGSKEMLAKQQLLASSNAKAERADQMHARAAKLEEVGFGSAAKGPERKG